LTAFAGYTIADLRQIVRDLTGIYSTDLISDDMINSLLNQAYFELATMQQWPWKVGLEPLAALIGTDYPPFLATSHKLLAYRASAHVLETQADDSPRLQEYNAIWQLMVGELYQNTLQANSTGSATSFTELKQLVRELIDIFDQTITDAYITVKLQDELSQLYDSYTWPFAKADFFTAASSYTRILAFGTASRLAATYNKDQTMISSYLSEYEAMLDQMKKVFLYPIINEQPGTFADLRKQVRGLIQDYSKDIPDTLLSSYINEEYLSLCNSRDWTWLEKEEAFNITTGQQEFQLTPKGSRRVLVMYATTNTNSLYYPGDTSSPLYQRPDILGQEFNSSKYTYDVTTDGLVRLSPPALTPYLLKVKYIMMPDMLISDSDEPLFDIRFRSILAYRAALRLLLFTKSDKNLIAIYQNQADTMFQSMMVHYQLDRSTDVFSINQNGLDVMKYIPYFRVS